MSAPQIVLLVLLVVAAAGGGVFLYFWARFRATPEYRWAADVRRLAAGSDSRARAAEREVADAGQRLRLDGERLRQDALQHHFRSVSVEGLADYPGIGPVTVARLREHGYHTLADVRSVRTDIPGLGPKRMGDLRNAISALVRDAISRFEAGATAEAQELNRRLAALQQEMAARVTAAHERKRAADAQLAQLRRYIEIADGVRLGRFYRREGYPGLTPDLLSRPVESLIPPPPPAPPAPTLPTVIPPPVVMPAGGAVQAEPVSGPPVLPPTPPKPAKPAPADLFRSALESEHGAVPAVGGAAPHPRLPHLRLTTELGFAVARADGRVAASEREAVRRHLHRAFGHEPELVPYINPLCEQVEKATPDLADCLERAKELFRAEELGGLVTLAVVVADAAGKRNKKEEECLNQVRAALGLPEPQSEPVAPARAPGPALLSPSECRAILEIAPAVPLTADLVRRQYRMLRERFDPARFESHGHEFIDVARRKMERIEAAAVTLLQGMNEPLEAEAPKDEPKDLRHNPDLDAIFG